MEVRTLTLRWLHMSHALRSRVALEFGTGDVPTGAPATPTPRYDEASASAGCCGVTGLSDWPGVGAATAAWSAWRP
jgi:hypothetical protein